MDPRNITVGLVRDFFGSPILADSIVMVYPLTLWPAHQYEWEIGEAGRVSHGGIRLREELQLPSWLPRNLESVSDFFRLWHHTSHDVFRVLGEPDSEVSWGSDWEWHYVCEGEMNQIVFDFGHGLLREIRGSDQ